MFLRPAHTPVQEVKAKPHKPTEREMKAQAFAAEQAKLLPSCANKCGRPASVRVEVSLIKGSAPSITHLLCLGCCEWLHNIEVKAK